ncbi:unnamed protein product [Heligmosomoides polygyrus]|uniref:PPM-type phosphatase domain-containing protein n=1 Tax=Heligmosomoides polygyrus TaxID=6339 RepID=A0A183GHC1_HELPZ|nr:unnamed protein product [Heligmosomoides polygyrus]
MSATIRKVSTQLECPEDMVEALRQEVEKLQRATKDDHEAAKTDTGALGLFFRYPDCTVKTEPRTTIPILDKLFQDVVPSAGGTMGNLRFDTIFSLARLISIFESERDVDRKRLSHDDGTGVPINQMNELNNEGVRFAKQNSWKDVCAIEKRQQKILLFLSDGFHDINAVLKKQNMVEC